MMRVAVGNRLYKMSNTEYKGLLKVAAEQVPMGIYAIEKADYAELRCDRCKSMTELKKISREFKSKGYRVHANRGK